MSKATVIRRLKESVLLDEFWEGLTDDAVYVRTYLVVMVEEYARYIKVRGGVKAVTPVEMWRKALELSGEYDLPFCRDFLPFLDEEEYKELGKSYRELMAMTINYGLWKRCVVGGSEK